MGEQSFPVYQDKDDGIHFFENESYYEWWYFDARFDNGYSCVITFHYRNLILKPRIPSIQIFVYAPDGKRHIGMKAFDVKEAIARDAACDVRIGECFVYQEDDAYKVNIHAKDVGAELVFQKRLPGWKPTTGFVFKREHMEQGWVVPIPRAEVEGRIHIGDRVLPVKGIGYHDHNWGNANIYDCYRGWYWGRLYDATYTLIYAWMLPLEEPHPIPPVLYLAKDDTPIFAKDQFEFKVMNEELHQATGKMIPKNILIKTAKDNTQLECRLNTTGVAEGEKLPTSLDWPQYHWRLLGDYEADITIGGLSDRFSGEVIHELVLLR